MSLFQWLTSAVGRWNSQEKGPDQKSSSPARKDRGWQCSGVGLHWCTQSEGEQGRGGGGEKGRGGEKWEEGRKGRKGEKWKGGGKRWIVRRVIKVLLADWEWTKWVWSKCFWPKYVILSISTSTVETRKVPKGWRLPLQWVWEGSSNSKGHSGMRELDTLLTQAIACVNSYWSSQHIVNWS